jgi:hypothetical protein
MQWCMRCKHCQKYRVARASGMGLIVLWCHLCVGQQSAACYARRLLAATYWSSIGLSTGYVSLIELHSLLIIQRGSVYTNKTTYVASQPRFCAGKPAQMECGYCYGGISQPRSKVHGDVGEGGAVCATEHKCCMQR